MHHWPSLLIVLSLAVLSSLSDAATISTEPVGNPGNPGSSVLGIGAVSYTYSIGTFEVTNAEYVDFLRAKAASDPLSLYNSNMGSDPRGGILQTGLSGSFDYGVRPNMGNKPVNFVSWYDAIRFVNWLHNGQGAGDTESGAYILVGGTPIPSNGNPIARQTGATWMLPKVSEAFKAAYYQPAAAGGDSDGYWSTATRSNAMPTVAAATASGDISNPGANVVNYSNGADWNGQDGNVTSVGSAGALSASYYGTFDQSGNVAEWLETSIDPGTFAPLIFGGRWSNTSAQIVASSLAGAGPTAELATIGFRVAAVPEPDNFVMAALGIIVLIYSRYIISRPRRI